MGTQSREAAIDEKRASIDWSVEDTFYTYPFLFFLSLSHPYLLLLLFVEFWLFGLVDLFPPSLFPVGLSFWLFHYFLLLEFFFFGKLAAFFA